jgi:hypothetical protein
MSENQKTSSRGSPPGTPGWVKAFIIVLILLVGIVVVVHLLGVRFDHGGGGTLLGGLAILLERTAQQL